MAVNQALRKGGKVQHAPPPKRLPDSALAFPFKKQPTSKKYAQDSKRLVSMLGINIRGIESHRHPNDLYTSIGHAIHRLPSTARSWLEKYGKNVTIEVTKDGSVAFPWLDTAFRKGRAGGYFESTPFRDFGPFSQNIVVGAQRKGFDSVEWIFAHEFAHWLDVNSEKEVNRIRGPHIGKGMTRRPVPGNSVSGSNTHLFGDVTSRDAPHGERRGERFANTIADYVGSEESRAQLDPNVIKFLDRFLGPQLMVDSGATGGRLDPGTHARKRLVRRVSAIKLAYFGGLMTLPVFNLSGSILEKELQKIEAELMELERQ
jgi:hypothetical protein